MPWRTAILVPCYRRPEYTAKCLKALEGAQAYPQATFLLVDDGSGDGTDQLLLGASLPKEVIVRDGNLGLRATLIEFIAWALEHSVDLLGVIGNDCLMPAGWLDQLESAFETTDADILSPNVLPSNAAYIYGAEDVRHRGYRPARIVGGLWFMRRAVAEAVTFEPAALRGISGAMNVLHRIILEKEPKVGWLPEIAVQDLGHWSGEHPDHIKSEAHRAYASEVGRRIAW